MSAVLGAKRLSNRGRIGVPAYRSTSLTTRGTCPFSFRLWVPGSLLWSWKGEVGSLGANISEPTIAQASRSAMCNAALVDGDMRKLFVEPTMFLLLLVAESRACRPPFRVALLTRRRRGSISVGEDGFSEARTVSRRNVFRSCSSLRESNRRERRWFPLVADA